MKLYVLEPDGSDAPYHTVMVVAADQTTAAAVAGASTGLHYRVVASSPVSQDVLLRVGENRAHISSFA